MPVFDFADGLPAKIKEKEKTDPLTIGEKLLGDILLNLKNLKQRSNRPIELRASGLPFCGLKRFILDDRQESYTMEHYTSTGTAIHETLQKWIPFGDYRQYMFGDWQCLECERVKKWQTLPGKCKCGQENWKYKELSISYKKLTGHIDLVLKLPTTPVSYIVVDFKTTDMHKKRASRYWDPHAPSSRNYVVQIRTYCALLNLIYKLNVRGWIVVSVNRAKPIEEQLDYHPLSGEWSPKMSKRWMPYLDKANEDFRRLKRLMRHLKEKNIDEASDALKNMVRGRPCKDEESYKKWMHYAFFGKDICALKKSCCKLGNAAVLADVKKRLREKA